MVALVQGVRLASHAAWPKKVLGLYVLLADDDEDGYESKAEWEPQLFEWQQQAANVLFFTFIHPDTMEVGWSRTWFFYLRVIRKWP
jgi:hypothetical protein